MPAASSWSQRTSCLQRLSRRSGQSRLTTVLPGCTFSTKSPASLCGCTRSPSCSKRSCRRSATGRQMSPSTRSSRGATLTCGRPTATPSRQSRSGARTMLRRARRRLPSSASLRSSSSTPPRVRAFGLIHDSLWSLTSGNDTRSSASASQRTRRIFRKWPGAACPASPRMRRTSRMASRLWWPISGSPSVACHCPSVARPQPPHPAMPGRRAAGGDPHICRQAMTRSAVPCPTSLPGHLRVAVRE
mmetsp:Transcript_86047/g.277934  ORF Transcript_86047/g.277934 Transcript_86047/m.277934 type:complete len:245 (+) Transcript_86047:310-1044(+)